MRAHLRQRAPKSSILRAMETEVWPLMEKRTIAPVIHKVLPIAETAEAHRILADNENVGKVVLRV